MSRLYRILRKKFAGSPFDGEGAYRYGGRWSSAGTRLSYASEHQSLAMLEYFVHLDKDDPPDDLVLTIADIPAGLSRRRIDPAHLPSQWRDPVAPSELARFGGEFVREARHCLLFVPSALAPSENNVLINPAHPDSKRIALLDLEPLHYDLRLFSKPARRRRR